MNNLPLVVSYPRCGRHWLVSCIECYFRRPCTCRLNNFLTTSERSLDPLFTHHHDETVRPYFLSDNVLYLYRDPVDALFSFSLVDHRLEKEFTLEEWVEFRTVQYRKHLLKYLTSSPVFIKYERLVTNFTEEFSKACRFFGVEPEEERIDSVNQFVTKEKMVGQTKWLTNILDSVEDKRKEFCNRFGESINKSITKSKLLCSYF